MRLLILGINYSPEPTGIAVYTAGLARDLVRRGHEVTVICAPPHYPGWRVMTGYSGWRFARERIDGVRIVRCPLYVPADTGSAKRSLHYASFALSSFVPALAASLSFKPDLVLAVVPSLASAPVARLAAALAGARSWLHVQDFEVEAAFATGVIGSGGLVARFARGFERRVLRSFDRVSTISPQMRRKLHEKGVPAERTYELRNWADIDRVKPQATPSGYREEWNVRAPHVALYSGSIGNKQGLEIIIDAARHLRDREDIVFVMCGEGPNRARVEKLAAGLSNIQFRNLQPIERLGDLMNLATIHLLPQIEDAADLVLPSKLTNMLASGRPVVATAAAGTGLHDELIGCGITTPPGDLAAFAKAIAALADDAVGSGKMGRTARSRAEARLASGPIIDQLEWEMLELTGKDKGAMNEGVAT